MYPLLDWSSSALAAGSMLTTGVVLVRLYDPGWWGTLWFRLMFGALVSALTAGFALWLYGWTWSYYGVGVVWTALPIAAFTLLGLLLEGVDVAPSGDAAVRV